MTSLAPGTGYHRCLLRYKWVESKLSHSFCRYTELATYTHFVRYSLLRTQLQSQEKTSPKGLVFSWLSLQVMDFADTILDIEP